jgi:adenylylsulfate kinase
MLIQLTGLSGSGKTTIATCLKHKLEQNGLYAEIVDGDYYRTHLCKDLGYSKADRHENIRRLGKVAFELSKKGAISIISAINPYEEIRLEIKQKYSAYLVYIQCNLSTLIKRDTKGLYLKGLLPDEHPQKLQHFTGISDPFEIPGLPDLTIHTSEETIEDSAGKLLNFILTRLEKNQRDKTEALRV